MKSRFTTGLSSPRWAHRTSLLEKRARAADEFKMFDPLGIVPDRKPLVPQPYPKAKASFYYKPGKYFFLVHKGKIGTFEQWGTLLGVDPTLLRSRVRVCGMTLEEALVSDPLNTTNHVGQGFRAQKYCSCVHCVARRKEALSASIKPTKTINPPDKRRLFQRSDLLRLVEINGELLNLYQLSDRYGIPYKTLYARIFRYGWTIQRSIEESTYGDGRGKKKA